MTTAQQKPNWALRLSAIASELRAGRLSAWEAAYEVRAAYIAFLEDTLPNPIRWIAEEYRVWHNRKKLGESAANLRRWVKVLKAKGGKRKAFFASPELQAAIEAIRRAYNRELERRYGPPAWRWEP